MILKNLATVLTGLLLMIPAAQARENFTLQLNDQETNGNATLMLRQLLQQQHNINPGNFRLVGVRLVAKSRQGQGSARLKVGNWESNDKRVNGNPLDFNRPGAGTFDQIDFSNSANNDNGAWQILLHGNIKTRKVVVVLDRSGGGGGGGIRYQEVRCDSINNMANQCPVNGRVVSLRLLRQHSRLPCNLNQSFGALKRAIWVRNGCRGTFQVGIR
jgi:hypothetical protein